jgi:hypothetical protein
MLKQIIKGEKLIPIKFHGNVKHIVFACNVCGKEFIKPESYFKKQSKKRQHACCFCSPKCRSKYLYEHKEPSITAADLVSQAPEPETVKTEESSSSAPKTVETPVPTPVPAAPAAPAKKGGIFSKFLRSFLTNK